MNNNPKNKKYQRYIQIAIAVLLLYIIIINVFVNETKVYVIAKVDNISTGAHSNTDFSFKYRFKGKTYTGGISGNFLMTDSFIVIKVSSKSPSIYALSHDLVPKCIADEKYMDYYWDSEPNCSDMKLSK